MPAFGSLGGGMLGGQAPGTISMGQKLAQQRGMVPPRPQAQPQSPWASNQNPQMMARAASQAMGGMGPQTQQAFAQPNPMGMQNAMMGAQAGMGGRPEAGGWGQQNIDMGNKMAMQMPGAGGGQQPQGMAGQFGPAQQAMGSMAGQGAGANPYSQMTQAAQFPQGAGTQQTAQGMGAIMGGRPMAPGMGGQAPAAQSMGQQQRALAANALRNRM